MERITEIPKGDISEGVYIELECCMCGKHEIFADSYIEKVMQIIRDGGWYSIDSDKYGVIGHYCGCEYIND